MASSATKYVVIIFTIVCLWTFSSGRELDGDNLVTYERRLYKELLDNYEKAVRPVRNSSELLEVTLGLALLTFGIPDENKHTFISTSWIRMSWKDPQLTWDPPQNDNIMSINIPAADIWTPDLTIHNGVGEMVSVPLTHLAVVQHDGIVMYVPPVFLATRCSADVRLFPYDTQTCNIEIGSWSYSMQEVNITVDRNEIDLDAYYTSNYFYIAGSTAHTSVVKYNQDQKVANSVAVFSLTFKRKSKYDNHLLLAPSVTLSLVIPTVYFMPVGSTERTTLGIGILIAHILLLGELIRMVPAGHQLGMPIMSQFLLANIVLVSLTLAVSAAVISLWSRGLKQSTGPGAVWKLIFLNRIVTTIFCIQKMNTGIDNPVSEINESTGSGPSEVTTSNPTQLTDDRMKIMNQRERDRIASEWRGLADVIDRVFLIAFFVVIAVLCLGFIQFL